MLIAALDNVLLWIITLITTLDKREREQFLNNQARIVAKVNAPAGADIAQIVRKTRGGLRRVYTEIEKLKMTAE